MNHIATPLKSFREDINAIRAVAILSVLIYHFNFFGFETGWIGVDIFFVISGYLMTAIILGKIEKEKFSFSEFYLSRLRRVFPALFFVMSVVLLFGYFYLPTTDLKNLANEIRYGVIFSSNFYLLENANYFDRFSIERWFLHLWSLSVEAQFYLFYPIVLYFSYKYGKIKTVTYAVLSLLMASFAINFYFQFNEMKNMAFYSIISREWEFILGGIAYFIERNKVIVSKLTYALGWATMILSAVFIQNGHLEWAIIPVIATMVVIAGNRSNRFIDNDIVQYVGDRSYSIYLWHWVLIVFLHYTSQFESDIAKISMLIISFIMAEFSYQFIEKPTRNLNKNTGLKIEGYIIFLLIVGMFFGASYLHKNSLDRVDTRAEKIANEILNHAHGCLLGEEDILDGKKGCALYSGETKAFLIGDSHAQAAASALEDALKIKFGEEKSIEFRGMSGCATIKDAIYSENTFAESKETCKTFNDGLLKELSEKKGVPVIAMSRWSLGLYGDIGNNFKPFLSFHQSFKTQEAFEEFYKGKLTETMCSIAKNNTLYVVTPVPEMMVNVPQYMSRQLSIFGKEVDSVFISRAEYDKRHKIAMSALKKAEKDCGVHLIDVTDIFCDEEKCYSTSNGYPLFHDFDHLSQTGNKVLVNRFLNIL